MTDETDLEVEITSYHYFEVMDRTHTVFVMFDTLIMEHPALDDDSELKQKAEEIQNDLWDLCQLSSEKFDSAMMNEQTKSR